jgi:uracil-DNA glycosylase
MDVKIESSWKTRLAGEFEKPYFTQLVSFIKEEYQSQKIYPPGKLIFNAFDKCLLTKQK